MFTRHGWRITLGVLCLSGVSASAADFCQRSRSDLFQAFKAPENRIAFSNSGGLLNGGVCWWHSRLQRSAIYLTRFDPSLRKPTRAEARTILHTLAFQNAVVTIPGYSNFHDFSADFEPEFQTTLNQWQIRDGFIAQQWIRGLYGKPRLCPRRLHRRMDHLYQRFQKSEPGLWVMVQLKGITSHALLLIDMKKTDQGYLLTAIDSNHPAGTILIPYQIGDSSLELSGDEFTPYAGFESDHHRIQDALSRYCSGSSVGDQDAIDFNLSARR